MRNRNDNSRGSSRGDSRKTRPERNTATKETFAPRKKYRDASKSDSGWTKPDGKPMRKRIDKDKPAKTTAFQKEERPKRSFSNPARSFDKKGTADLKSKPSFKRADENKEERIPPFKRNDTYDGSSKSFSSKGSRTDFRKNSAKLNAGRDITKPVRSFDKRTSSDFKSKSFSPGSNSDESKSFPRKREYVKRDRKDGYQQKMSRNFKSKPFEQPENYLSGIIRLNRFIANAGICSRREADQFITAGLVSVNGKIITELGTKITPGDDIRYNGERLRGEKNVYILLNKPKDYITTADDPQGRKTVMELIAKACKERVYPVGRLDRNTTGVLLFTNDGELTDKLMHPSSEIRKIYHVELDKGLKATDLKKCLEGIELEDGLAVADDIAYTSGADKKEVGVELHSGRNRIVRRMFEHLGYEVRKLDRVSFAGLTKKDLPRGRWRMLTELEISSLKMMTGKSSRRKKQKEDNSQLKLF